MEGVIISFQIYFLSFWMNINGSQLNHRADQPRLAREETNWENWYFSILASEIDKVR